MFKDHKYITHQSIMIFEKSKTEFILLYIILQLISSTPTPYSCLTHLQIQKVVIILNANSLLWGASITAKHIHYTSLIGFIGNPLVRVIPIRDKEGVNIGIFGIRLSTRLRSYLKDHDLENASTAHLLVGIKPLIEELYFEAIDLWQKKVKD